jgi:colicin import membrane protein
MGGGASPAPLATPADRAFDDALALGEIKDASGKVVKGGFGIFALRNQFKANFAKNQAAETKERAATKKEAARLEDLRARQARVDAFRAQSETRGQFLSETKANVPIREAREQRFATAAANEKARLDEAGAQTRAAAESKRQAEAKAVTDRSAAANAARAQAAAAKRAQEQRELEARRKQERQNDKR